VTLSNKACIEGSLRFFDFLNASPQDATPDDIHERMKVVADYLGLPSDRLDHMWFALNVIVLRRTDWPRDEQSLWSCAAASGFLWALYVLEAERELAAA
jgi:hypothetical protein